MSIKCPKCQADNPDAQRFCGDCGTQLPGTDDISIPIQIHKLKHIHTFGAATQKSKVQGDPSKDGA
ncbi:MAG: zinc ribbon domain-containing protein [Candidatus Aminicenantes bacterium]